MYHTLIVSDALVMGLDKPPSKLPYFVYESMIGSDRPLDQMFKGVTWIMNQQKQVHSRRFARIGAADRYWRWCFDVDSIVG